MLLLLPPLLLFLWLPLLLLLLFLIYSGAFELEATIQEKVSSGQWVGECFLFTNEARKLNYVVGGEVMTLVHLNHALYLLGKEDCG